MAKELAGYGIRVNALAPGMIETDMGGDAGSALGGLQIPLGRYGTPEEVPPRWSSWRRQKQAT